MSKPIVSASVTSIKVNKHERELLEELAARWGVSRDAVAKMVFAQGVLDCRRWLHGADTEPAGAS